MPSRFEPCGLTQLISFRYGTVPIVRETGGLKDTVVPYNEYTNQGEGFSFANYNAEEMLNTINYSKYIFFEKKRQWNQMVERGMNLDYSWKFLAGIILGKWKGVVCTVIYLLLGMVGLPVFNGFSGGVQKLVGPTGGYLIGYLFLVFFTGLFVEKFPNKIPMYFVGGIIGIIVCYAFGTVWFVLQYKVGFLEALTMCVFPYIPMDLVKLVAAVIIGSQVRKILIGQNLILINILKKIT